MRAVMFPGFQETTPFESQRVISGVNLIKLESALNIAGRFVGGSVLFVFWVQFDFRFLERLSARIMNYLPLNGALRRLFGGTGLSDRRSCEQ